MAADKFDLSLWFSELYALTNKTNFTTLDHDNYKQIQMLIDNMNGDISGIVAEVDKLKLDQQSSDTQIGTISDEQKTIKDRVETLENNDAHLTDKINESIDGIASINNKIDNQTTSISELTASSNDNKTNIATNAASVTQLNTEYEDLAKDINDLTADKANKVDLKTLATKDELTQFANSFGWQTNEHGWNTLWTPGAAVIDYPPNNETLEYSMNDRYKLLDVNEHAYWLVVVKNLDIQNVGLIQTLNKAGDPIRYTQTTDDYIVRCVWDYTTDKSTIDIDFLTEDTRDLEIILLEVPQHTNDV